MTDVDHPRSDCVAPPRGGNASGPAQPEPRRSLGNGVDTAVDTREPAAARPSPARAIESAFRRILREQMQDMPMLNPALAVEAVGFRPWADHWLGVLVTPWFMNLWLMPRVSERWQAIGERETRHYVFPAGVFEFIGGRDPLLGDYQACSLFSPMFEFVDQAEAHDTAVAVLDALFDQTLREPERVPAPEPKRAISKRDFLFGSPPRGDRGP